ncbi:hypothetical protein M422DRAFT_241039 [Sphaerobolus stellatus SS14]|nr:hypothetical protein M422DRAFT_241039 [Sphaerobolus stellatus SS14]
MPLWTNFPPGFVLTKYLIALSRSRYLGVCSLTFFLYDILLTLGDEIKYIHQGTKWTLPKCIYILNRYYVLIVMIINTLVLVLPVPSNELYVACVMLVAINSDIFCSCVFGIKFSGLGGIFSKFILDFWLLLRVYAIWGKDHTVLVILLTGFTANIAISTGVTIKGLQEIQILPFSADDRWPGMAGCIVQGEIKTIWIAFVSCMLFEVMVVTLTSIRAFRHWRAGFGRRDTPVFTHLYSTGITYFAGIALTMAFMSGTALTPLQEVVLPAQLLSAIISSVGARMMIGIREVIEGDPDMHISALRPSELEISNFYLTPLPLSTLHTRTRRPSIQNDQEETPHRRPEAHEPQMACSTQENGRSNYIP